MIILENANTLDTLTLKELLKMKDLKDVLVVVDVQNDFVTGALGSKDAQAVIPNIVARVKEYIDAGKHIIFTMDKHESGEEYYNSKEGKQLPVIHCVEGTPGFNLVPRLGDILGWENIQEWFDDRGDYDNISIITKEQFGSCKLPEILNDHFSESSDAAYLISADAYYPCKGSVEFIGLDTDCCVMANAVTVRTMNPNVDVAVNAECCAGVTPESHKNALALMEQYQIEIM